MVDKKDVMMVVMMVALLVEEKDVMMVETTDKMSELLAVMKFAML